MTIFKALLLCCLFTLMACSSAKLPVTPAAESMVIASFNIRFDNPADIDNPWFKRKYLVADIIQQQQFDLVGTQEVMGHQLQDLLLLLPGFKAFGQSRDADPQAERSAILYRDAKVELLEQGHFWLSETPELPGLGWDAAINRISSWGKFRQRASGTVFYLFNTHFDHQGSVAQRESSTLMLRKIAAISAGLPVILTGDFNVQPASDSYQLLNSSALLQDSAELAVSASRRGTLNGFSLDTTEQIIIDHIFVSKQFNVLSYNVIIRHFNGKLASDHYPVKIALQIR